MPPKMKRQNAFTEEHQVFKEIACRICYQSEACGEWKRITCQCSIAHDYYHAHEFCLQRTRKCKVCSTLYTEQKLSPKPRIEDKIYAFLRSQSKRAYDMIYKYGYKSAIVITVIACMLLVNDLVHCTTLEKIDQNELPDLIEDSEDYDMVWLPVSIVISKRGQ